MKYLVFDISNLLYATFFVHKQETDTTIAGLAAHSALMTLNKYYRQFKPDKVVMAFDRSSWRKEYTASEECVSKRPYKGNRRQNMTSAEQAKYERFCAHVNDFENLITNYTSIISLAGKNLEADDLIGGFVQTHQDDEIIIVSADHDFLQLLKFPNVTIFSPKSGKKRDLSEYHDDPIYYLYLKYIRGDIKGDHIQSALPGVREKAVYEAYNDPYKHEELMRRVWKDPNGREFVVRDLFNENKKLINLEQQPEEIRERILHTINEEMARKKRYSFFHMLRFLKKLELNKITENLESFEPLLSR